MVSKGSSQQEMKSIELLHQTEDLSQMLKARLEITAMPLWEMKTSLRNT